MGEAIKLLIAAVIGEWVFKLCTFSFLFFLESIGVDNAEQEARDSLRWGFSFIALVFGIVMVLLFFGIDPFYLASTPPDYVNEEIKEVVQF